MTDYTPTTEQVRDQYTREQPPHINTASGKSAEFDRWLTEHERKVKAAALRVIEQAFQDYANGDIGFMELTDRTYDAIESEEKTVEKAPYGYSASRNSDGTFGPFRPALSPEQLRQGWS